MRKNMKGILYAFLASVIYGIVPLTSKLIISDGTVSESAMLGWRFLFASFFGLLVIFVNRVPIRPTRTQARDILLFGVVGTLLTSLLLTRSYRYIDLGLATVCHFFYPIAVCIIMRIFFREKLSSLGICAVLVTGAALVILASHSGASSLLGMGIAVISGIFWASYLVAFEKASYARMNQNVAVFWIMFGNSVLCILMSILQKEFGLPSISKFLLLCLSALMMTGAMLLTVKAISLCGPTMTAFISLFEPITAVITDMIVYHAFPDIIQTAGYLLMGLAIVVITMKDDRSVHDTE